MVLEMEKLLMKKYLPIGSVVQLKNGNRKIMIINRFPLFRRENEVGYDTIKDGAYKLVDLGEQLVENTGKAIESAWNDLKSVGQNVSDYFNSNSKMLASWFGG
ncbi:DUF4176 domain-containing protein [Streptococcus iners subsp. hyiners]|uniref:DUF4176 domain-containing protein n=2 Tax=Streptococcus iners TaxID=3028084 RepID=A0AA96VIE1_9STRE|nr:DUF4176 domain-containing protein [Streptococcus sp. 29892]